MVASVSFSHTLSLTYLDPHPVVCVLALCVLIFANLTYSFLRMTLILHTNRVSHLNQVCSILILNTLPQILCYIQNGYFQSSKLALTFKICFHLYVCVFTYAYMCMCLHTYATSVKGPTETRRRYQIHWNQSCRWF